MYLNYVRKTFLKKDVVFFGRPEILKSYEIRSLAVPGQYGPALSGSGSERSKAEALLPLADDLKLLSTAEALLNIPSSYLFGIASLLLVGGACVLLQLQIGPRHEVGWGTGPGCWNVNGSSHREPRAAAPVSAAHMRCRSVHVEFSTLWTRLARFCGVCMLCYYLFAYISRDLNSFVLYMHFY